jgi:hypothetical protein
VALAHSGIHEAAPNAYQGNEVSGFQRKVALLLRRVANTSQISDAEPL